jgi:2-desacetyl-2-hydroxyethyl bacteriochlorophyllide A dehydrogenase
MDMTDPIRRAVVRPDGVALIESDRPRVGAKEVGVEMLVSGVCGSDTHAAAGEHPFLKPPYFPGHEVVGIIRERGSEVSSVQIGDRITVEPTLPCWTCKMCLTHRSNICENLGFFGCGADQGGMADYFTIPANRVHILPESISELDAALIEPLATPVHAERLSGGVKDKSVVVLGAGTIGLLMLAAVRYAGAKQVVVTDVLESKRARASALGADAVFDASSPTLTADVRGHLGESADVIFDCVAIQSTIDQAIALATKGGSVMIVGVPAKPLTVPVPSLQEYQIRLQGCATYMPDDYIRAIDIIQAGAASASDIITAQIPLERVAEAFALSATGTQVKVVLTATTN